jgi:hypothetical protein
MERALQEVLTVLPNPVPDPAKPPDVQRVDQAVADFVEASQRMIAIS